MGTTDSLPDDVAALKAMVIATQAELLAAQAKAHNLEAEAKARALLIAQMKFTTPSSSMSGSGNHPSAARCSISLSLRSATWKRTPRKPRRRPSLRPRRQRA